MSIRYIEETKHLILETKNSGYHMKIDHLGYLQHMYYGPKPGQDNLSCLMRSVIMTGDFQEILMT